MKEHVELLKKQRLPAPPLNPNPQINLHNAKETAVT
jgi:hypothetical protein